MWFTTRTSIVLRSIEASACMPTNWTPSRAMAVIDATRPSASPPRLTIAMMAIPIPVVVSRVRVGCRRRLRSAAPLNLTPPSPPEAEGSLRKRDARVPVPPSARMASAGSRRDARQAG